MTLLLVVLLPLLLLLLLLVRTWHMPTSPCVNVHRVTKVRLTRVSTTIPSRSRFASCSKCSHIINGHHGGIILGSRMGSI